MDFAQPSASYPDAVRFREELLRRPIVTDWDRPFLANDQFLTWLIEHAIKEPIPPNQLLSDYVSQRVQKSSQNTMQRAPPVVAAHQPKPNYVQPTHMTFQQQPMDTYSTMNPSMIYNNRNDHVNTAIATQPYYTEVYPAQNLVTPHQGFSQGMHYDSININPASASFQSASIDPSLLNSNSAVRSMPPQAFHNPSNTSKSISEMSALDYQKLLSAQEHERQLKTSETRNGVKQDAKSSPRPASEAAPSPSSQPAQSPVQPLRKEKNAVVQLDDEADAWQKGLQAFTPLLARSKIQKAPQFSAEKISKHLAVFNDDNGGVGELGDGSYVPLHARVEVLNVLLNFGTPQFWESWCKDDGLKVLSEWLLGGLKDKTGYGAQKTIPKLVKIVAKLPLKKEDLRQYKFGARIQRVSKSTTFDAETKGIASRLVNKWTQWNNEPEPVKTEGKRKAGESAEAPIKKTKIEASKAFPASPGLSSLPSFKKQTGAVSKVSALFGPSKPAKAPTPSATSASTPTSAPTPPSKEVSVSSSLQNVLDHGKKKKRKSVTWADENNQELEHIKFIDRAIYGDENGNAVTSTYEDIRLMEEQEGETLGMHMDFDMEEEIDWYTPIPVKNLPPREAVASQAAVEEMMKIKNVPPFDYDQMELDDDASPGSPARSNEEVIEIDTKEIVMPTEMEQDAELMRAITAAQSSTIGEDFAQDVDIGNLLSALGSSSAAVPKVENALNAISPDLLNQLAFLQKNTNATEFSRGESNNWGAEISRNTHWEYKQPIALKGKRPQTKRVICRYYNSRKGCDWGDKCRNIHNADAR